MLQCQAVGKREAGSVGGGHGEQRVRTTDGHGAPEVGANPLGEAGDCAAPATEDDLAHRRGAFLARVVIERKPQFVRQPTDVDLERRPRRGRRRRVAFDLLERRREAGMDKPPFGVFEAQAGALGEFGRNVATPN